MGADTDRVESRGRNGLVEKRAKEWSSNLSLMMGAFDEYRKGQISITLGKIGISPLPSEVHLWVKSQAECLTVCDPASKLYEKLPKDVRKRIDDLSAPVALIVASALFIKSGVDNELEVSRQIALHKNAGRVVNNVGSEPAPGSTSGGYTGNDSRNGHSEGVTITDAFSSA